MSRFNRRAHYESDDASFPAAAYRVQGYAGIAWHVLGWETEPDEDTEWSGCENRTGQLVCVMVGDDRKFTFEPDEVAALEREEYCGVCGQIGCGHDGIDRSAEEA
jgi:hypothetical protein